jgi:hypothetical protein
VRDVVSTAIALVKDHPAIAGVRFAGSRSRGTHDELSDWDFAIETEDFDAVARDLPVLVAPLEPVGTQWEPVGHFPVYQVMLRGPTKVEYLFLDHHQDPMPPREPSRETLPAIDNHFWDWIWWIGTKAAAGRDDLVAEHLPQMHEYLLRPIGVRSAPETIDAAIQAFLERRSALEDEYGLSLRTPLQEEVTAGLARIGVHRPGPPPTPPAPAASSGRSRP